MLYEFTITTPANTPESAKQEDVLPLELGLIVDLHVIFPAGSARLLKLQLFRGASQVLPKGTGYFRGNNIYMLFKAVNYPLYTAPFELIAYTWNTSTKYEHSVDVLLEISRSGVYIE